MIWKQNISPNTRFLYLVIMECLQNAMEFNFDEITSASKASRLCFASRFLDDLHCQFLDILKFNSESHPKTFSYSDVQKDECTQSVFISGSFNTSTPNSKVKIGKDAFVQKKTHDSSPLLPASITNVQDVKSERHQKCGRTKVCLKDFMDDGYLKFKSKNGPKAISLGEKSLEVQTKFEINDVEFPNISEASYKSKRNKSSSIRRLSTTVVSNGNTKKCDVLQQSKQIAECQDLTSAFKNSTIIPAPASAMPRSLWAKPPQDIIGSSCSKSQDCLPSSPQASEPSRHFVFEASLENVSQTNHLNLLADIYSYLINEGLVSNVMNEISTIIQLLTLYKKEENDNDGGKKCFSTLSNIVYFSCRVLQNVSCFLESFDQETLECLCENVRLKHFAPGLVQNLLNQISICSQEELIQDEVVLCGGINFNEDTDTRSNFPSNTAFNTFKKQRDLFYQLMREWEREHLSIGWSMKMKTDTIYSILVGCQPDLICQLRFVRLFASQLIKTCCSGKSSRDISYLDELKAVDLSKLKRLQGRLNASHSPALHYPDFPKDQEFFKDFIALSSNNSFCTLLTNVLYSKIEELSDTAINLILNSSANCDTASSFQSGFLNHVKTLQILGKFLGFVTFLPYFTNESLSKTDECLLKSMRNKLPMENIVLSTLKQHLLHASLIIGLSWSLNYLSLMDQTALHLESTHFILKFLLAIHHSLFEFFSKKSKMFVLISRMLGWFFQLDIIPRDIFYESPVILEGVEMEGLQTSFNQNINISSQVVYQCHPLYLDRIRYLLQHSGHKFEPTSKLPLRKINPKLAPLNQSFKGSWSSLNNIQKKLEGTLFQMHSSVKRTVDCIFDRIFINWTLHFQSHQVQTQLQKAKNFAKDLVTNLSSGFDEDYLRSEISTKAQELKDDLCFSDTSTLPYCQNAELILETLLSESVVSQVLTIFISICCKNIREKASNWINENILPDTFKKEIIIEINKQFSLHDHLSQHSIHFDKCKSLNFTDEVIYSGGGDVLCQSTLSLGEESFIISRRAENYKVHEANSGGENKRSSHFESLEKTEETSMQNKSIQAIDFGIKVFKLKETSHLLPSEVIMSVQDLLTFMVTKPTQVILLNKVLATLYNIRLILIDEEKLLHPHSRSFLHSLVITLAVTIISQKQTLWDDHLEGKFLSLWGEQTESKAFEELLYAINIYKHPFLASFMEKLQRKSIIGWEESTTNND